ncbi:MAG TPA: cell division protein FtsZ [Niabella sp.]|nr:cell division protein FtsZ [Niabella sp.]HOZ95553.1 cell division protein FtsZ [Niabella sp.]HQW13793.1 cell division protein FtsZ [Niabella sp.]HQX19314.1 cell division protein FtsZ [Niabella sp.]HQX40830.1 cell division protein FtsZ [Niabella sp.]
MIQFDLPKEQSSILKVIGVGGGGGNAVNHMFSQNIDGVNFIICNTDSQALAQSQIPNRIQLGPQLTSGLGAGANPEIGRQATEESLEEVKRILEVNTKMVFITAGMGGGTGTGGAPIIAKICKNLGVLTVGIVTTPFAYEGKKRQLQAEEGIKQLKQYVDTLLVISNDKLRHQFGNLKMREAFERADNVLATAAKCITDVINSTGQINVDFADVCTVMKNGGVAILGSATASGENRAQRAIEEALNSPLLNDNDIRGAKWILININSSEGEHEFTMDEVEIIQSHLLDQAGETTDVILGMGYDQTLGDQIGITLIATGFENKELFVKPVLKKEEAAEGRILMPLIAESKGQLENVSPKAVAEQKNEENKSMPIELKLDPMAPKLVEDFCHLDAPMPTEEDVVNDDSEVKYVLSNEAEDIKFVNDVANFEKEVIAENNADTVFYSPSVPGERIIEQHQMKIVVEDMEVSNAGFSIDQEPQIPKEEAAKSFLAKPNNIYVETSEKEDLPVMLQNEVEEKDRMIVFEKVEMAEEATVVASAEPEKQKVIFQPAAVKTESEEELQRRRQMERIQKLRNLSFNANSNDPTDEFEHVPAYVRRNMELKNHTSHVENYYSKIEVAADDQNQGQINTINTFLDGKKPD